MNNSDYVSLEEVLQNYDYLTAEQKLTLLSNISIYVNFPYNSKKKNYKNKNIEIKSLRIIDAIIENKDMIFKRLYGFEFNPFKADYNKEQLKKWSNTELYLEIFDGGIYNKSTEQEIKDKQDRNKKRKYFFKQIKQLSLLSAFSPNCPGFSLQPTPTMLTIPKTSINFYYPWLKVQNYFKKLKEKNSPTFPWIAPTFEITYSNLYFDNNFHATVPVNFNYIYLFKNDLDNKVEDKYLNMINEEKTENPYVILDNILKITQPKFNKNERLSLPFDNIIEEVILKKEYKSKLFFLQLSKDDLKDSNNENNKYPIGTHTIYQRDIVVIKSTKESFITVNLNNLFIKKEDITKIKEISNQPEIGTSYTGDEIYFSEAHKKIIKLTQTGPILSSDTTLINKLEAEITNSLDKALETINKSKSDSKLLILSKRDLPTIRNLIKFAICENGSCSNINNNFLKVSQLIQKIFERPITLLQTKKHINIDDLYTDFEKNRECNIKFLKDNNLWPNLEEFQKQVYLITSKSAKSEEIEEKIDNSDYVRVLTKYFLPFNLKE